MLIVIQTHNELRVCLRNDHFHLKWVSIRVCNVLSDAHCPALVHIWILHCCFKDWRKWGWRDTFDEVELGAHNRYNPEVNRLTKTNKYRSINCNELRHCTCFFLCLHRVRACVWCDMIPVSQTNRPLGAIKEVTARYAVFCLPFLKVRRALWEYFALPYSSLSQGELICDLKRLYNSLCSSPARLSNSVGHKIVMCAVQDCYATF